jgi:hypothetical protein
MWVYFIQKAHNILLFCIAKGHFKKLFLSQRRFCQSSVVPTSFSHTGTCCQRYSTIKESKRKRFDIHLNNETNFYVFFPSAVSSLSIQVYLSIGTLSTGCRNAPFIFPFSCYIEFRCTHTFVRHDKVAKHRPPPPYTVEGKI